MGIVVSQILAGLPAATVQTVAVPYKSETAGQRRRDLIQAEGTMVIDVGILAHQFIKVRSVQLDLNAV